MNKYKNKTEWLFFSVKSRELFFFFAFRCFNIKELKFCHLSVDSVIVFYINTIIYSSLVLNLSEFLSSAEHKCYFEECGKPNSCWSSVTYLFIYLGDAFIQSDLQMRTL